MILEAVPSLWDGKWSIHVVWWRPEGFLTCLPIVCMALSCQTQLFCVIDCIRDSSVSRVDSVVSGAINFCSAMYAGVGLFGYVAFFSRTLHGDVLVELESSFFTQLLKLAFLLSIAVSVPLMLFPARIALFNLVLRPSNCELPVSNAMRYSTFHVLTFVILLCNLTIALLIPNVEFILGLTGALIGSLVCIVIPSILYIAVSKNKEHYTVSYAKICLVAGLFLWCASTWATLHVDRTVHVAEKPMPKDIPIDKPALKSLQKLEEKVLDANLNISAKLDNIADLAAVGKDKEAAHLLVEMKEERKKQEDLIRKQEKIVEELNKHVEEHQKEGKKSAEKKTKRASAEKEKKEGGDEAVKVKQEGVKEVKEAEKKPEEKTDAKKEEKELPKKEVEIKKEEKEPPKKEMEVKKEEKELPRKEENKEQAKEPKAAEPPRAVEPKEENKRIETRDIKNPKENPRESDVVKNANQEKPVETPRNSSEPVKTMESDKAKNDVPVPVPENSNISNARTESTKKSIEHVDV
ncbi:hypothetical protein Y032_0009g824 [Ancylostoma ceylanicum]|uniref:Amino acid transporter transmembrane domain-containing protein n=1 Tax=Ancylostoma ceylanicum TaxID=53326 RepID=A0A016VJN5_9BILA|nr:hypothetical protein Y032_0009g824 [Ancylostoma ceylanicum]